MGWYTGKRVFITGGSSGIGRALALAAAVEGAHVSIAARGQERLDVVGRELASAGAATVHTVVLDVADRHAWRPAAEAVLEALGGIDVVVANAGISRPGYFEELGHDAFQTLVDVNLHGTVNAVRAFLPAMRAQESGHIAIVSSTAGFLGVFGFTAYAASKFAVTGFAESLRQEVLRDGISVSVLYPPDTDTPLLRRENDSKPPETLMLSESAGVLGADVVARVALRGIRRGKAHITPGFANKLIRFAVFHTPWLVRFIIDRDLRKFAKSERLGRRRGGDGIERTGDGAQLGP